MIFSRVFLFFGAKFLPRAFSAAAPFIGRYGSSARDVLIAPLRTTNVTQYPFDHPAFCVGPCPPPQDKTGAVVYYEQLGKIDDEVLRRLGLDAKQMLWHYMYQARPWVVLVGSNRWSPPRGCAAACGCVEGASPPLHPPPPLLPRDSAVRSALVVSVCPCSFFCLFFVLSGRAAAGGFV